MGIVCGEWWNGFVGLIDDRGDICVGVCNPRLVLLCRLVVEMGVEELVLSVIFEIFECWRCRDGNLFV